MQLSIFVSRPHNNDDFLIIECHSRSNGYDQAIAVYLNFSASHYRRCANGLWYKVTSFHSLVCHQLTIGQIVFRWRPVFTDNSLTVSCVCISDKLTKRTLFIYKTSKGQKISCIVARFVFQEKYIRCHSPKILWIWAIFVFENFPSSYLCQWSARADGGVTWCCGGLSLFSLADFWCKTRDLLVSSLAMYAEPTVANIVRCLTSGVPAYWLGKLKKTRYLSYGVLHLQTTCCQ